MSGAVWWYLARASGLVAWGLVTATVVWGLAVSGHVMAAWGRPAWMLDLHRHMAGLSLAFVGVHLAALAADGYVHFGPAELLVPLASAWHPVAVAWGVLGLYLLVAVQATSLLVRRLPKRTWRAVHRTAVVVYLLVTVHALAAGSDAGSPAARRFALVSLALVAFLLTFRLLPPRPGQAGRSRRPAPAAPATPRPSSPPSGEPRARRSPDRGNLSRATMTTPTPSPKLAATVARLRPTGSAVETCDRPSAVTSAMPPANAKKNPAASR
jgi:DMSO/TMAO reductase YedYZ heme-binding membrane subunit